MKKHIILAVLLLSVLSACENEIRYKDENVAPKLILNALINIDRETNYVFLDYTGKTNVSMVNDGSVEISVNGEYVETCKPEKYPGYNHVYSYSTKARFKPGDVVRIDARAGNGKYHAWAEDIVPEYPILTTIDTLSTAFKDESYYYSDFKQLKFKIGIRDIPDKQNFYRVAMEHTLVIRGTLQAIKDTTVTVSTNHLWPWDDVVLTDGNPISSEEIETGFVERVRNYHGIFRDTRFVNTDYTMTVSSGYTLPGYYTYPYPGDYELWMDFSPEWMNIYTTVHLQSITESQYYYMSALNSLGSDYYDDFLYDPIAIPSNVNGGTGFVGFSSQTDSERLTIVKDYSFVLGR